MQLFPKLHLNSCNYLYKFVDSVLPNYPETYIQEDGEPSEDFKEEVRKYLMKNSGSQMVFREEQVEVEGGSGKLQTINNSTD